MSNAAGAQWQQFGDGPLSRAVALIYVLLVVEALFLVTTLPGLVPLLLLARDPSNIPLAALCLLPVGPALSAALFALRHRSRDLADLHPAAAFWRGYRGNVAGILRVWTPWLGWLSIVAINLAYFTAADVPLWWGVLLVLMAVAATLWAINALLITSLFAFRTKDVARLAAFFLIRTPGVALASACLLIVAGGVTYVSSDVVLAMLGSVLAAALLRAGDPMIEKIKKEFTA